MAITHPSKISPGLSALVLIATFGPFVYENYNHGWTEEQLFPLILIILINAFVFYLFFSTRYTIDGSKLYVRVGFIKYSSIDIETIKSVAKTSNWLSSPAASLDRIEVKYGDSKEIILSPRDKQEFANDLKNVNQSIDVRL